MRRMNCNITPKTAYRTQINRIHASILPVHFVVNCLDDFSMVLRFSMTTNCVHRLFFGARFLKQVAFFFHFFAHLWRWEKYFDCFKKWNAPPELGGPTVLGIGASRYACEKSHFGKCFSDFIPWIIQIENYSRDLEDKIFGILKKNWFSFTNFSKKSNFFKKNDSHDVRSLTFLFPFEKI